MPKREESQKRIGEIVGFYYLIFGNRCHSGMSQANARNEACDAVTLRYGISRGRLLNMLSERKYLPSVNEFTFRDKALSLIDILNTANQELDSSKARNEKLISLLKECLNER